jgi:periplasmic divalent cation tolerance protein
VIVTDLVIVLTTIDEERADEVAAALVHERLAACVNVFGPMRSTYRWKGVVETEPERQLFIKTTTGRLTALEARLRSIHPYELPEFIVIRPEAAGDDYAAWLRQSVAADSSAS